MSYRFIFRGVPVECDTVRELGAILRARVPRPRQEPDADDVTSAKMWKPSDAIRRFYECLPENEQVALAYIATCKAGGVSLSQVAAVAGFQNNRCATLMIMRWRRLASMHKLQWRRSRASLYMPGPLLAVSQESQMVN